MDRCYLGMKDPWKVLCILPTRDLDKIKAAYRAHVQRFHPDKAVTVEQERRYTVCFIELREAYRHATRMARYAPDLQPPLITRRPPDLSQNALLSQDWFVGLIVIAAGAFGLWLL